MLLAHLLLSNDGANVLVLRRIERRSLLHLLELLADEMLSFGHNSSVLGTSLVPSELSSKSPLREDLLASLSDLLHAFHGLERSSHEVSVVLDGDVALLGELRDEQRRIDNHLLSVKRAMRLGPLQLARLALHLEVLMAFRATKSEIAGVIADETNSLGWVHRARAKVTRFDPGDAVSQSQSSQAVQEVTYRILY